MEILKKELEIKYLKKTSSKRRGRRGRHSESPSSSSSGGEHPHASSADEKHST